MDELSEYIKRTSSIIRFLKENRYRIKENGIDDFFIEKFEKSLAELKDLESVQATYRLKYKTKTAQVDEKIDELNKFIARAEYAMKQKGKA